MSTERAVDDSDAEIQSASWERGPTPRAAVLVSTYRRAAFLPELVAALERQTFPRDEFEVVIVDNASFDDTWDVLRSLACVTPLRLRAALITENCGPSPARNLAATLSRAPVLAFTDDDCLPQPGWLDALVPHLERGAVVVQGRTEPDPGGLADAGPWDRTVAIRRLSHLFETCNIGYPRAAFDAAGRFDEHDPMSRGRAFGEDVMLATRVLDRYRSQPVFEPAAVVHHRLLPASFRDWLAIRRNLVDFPGLARRSDVFAAALWHGVFLNREHAAFDLAVVSVAVAVATRRPALAVGVAPWAALRWRAARWRPGNRLARLGQVAIGDAAELGWLVVGSIRHRRAVL